MLQEYNITFVPRKGVKPLDADGLSRNPLPTKEDKMFARMDHCAPKPGFHPVAVQAGCYVGSLGCWPAQATRRSMRA
jgi:hypothetical protein